MNNFNKNMLFAGLTLFSLGAHAQAFKEGYVNTKDAESSRFHTMVQNWERNHKLSDDDPFFISRVKPKVRFRNKATQVNKSLDETNDKRLIAWLPYDDPHKNALPDGNFNSEVFSLWSYVDHWGDWSMPLGRVPASLLDVAHKNGVGVSSVAGIPEGSLSSAYRRMFAALAGQDMHKKAASYLSYYGIDGLGYNSEFTTSIPNDIANVRNFHIALNKEMKTKNPVFENIWYDGTTDYGGRLFDHGLASHNQKNFGKEGEEAASLFFNYNWSVPSRLSQSVSYANSLKRSPLYLYAGINMQGGEPRNGRVWTVLKDYNISIGLWGAHSRNMFWESRNEKGSDPETMQRTYMLRTERWFTGGTRNPANCPAVGNSLQYHADNVEFQGMSPFMSARSTLSWDLAEEPFVTRFNLGNGKFFNWDGARQHNGEWANVGVQDYLPTWRWWFSTELMGRERSQVPVAGMDAEFVWDDAYMGGSTMRVYGSTNKGYLQLFKTRFDLKKGDVITLKYKMKEGAANLNLVLTAEGSETTEHTYSLRAKTELADAEEWVTKTFTVDNDFDGKKLALVALKFEDATNMNLYMGEMAITRGNYATPAQPVNLKGRLLSFNASGLDAKLTFEMTNQKAKGEPCYNQDVKTSLFKLYAQEEGKAAVCMGVTTSWGALIYRIPVDPSNANPKVKLGVSALSLDMKHESPITWTSNLAMPQYVYNDGVTLSQTMIKPNEPFKMSYVDPRHKAGQWRLLDISGNPVFTGNGNSVEVSGINNVGTYKLELTGDVEGQSTTRTFDGFVQVTDERVGALPRINSLTANGRTENISVEANNQINLAYTGRKSDGQLSRGVMVNEKGVGMRSVPLGFNSTTMQKAWTLSFWVKFNTIPQGEMQVLDLRDQTTTWPQNNWGSFWSTYNPKTQRLSFVIRKDQSGGDEHKTHWNVNFVPNTWTHLTFVMEHVQGKGVREIIYVNGKQAEVANWEFGGSTGTGLPTVYQSPGYHWGSDYNDSWFLIGKGRHQCAAIDGAVDDVKFFDRALNASDVAASMNNVEGTDNPVAFWNFEAAPAANHEFANTKTTAATIGAVDAVKGQNEGQARIQAIEPEFTAGSPFCKGTGFDVKTTAQWTAAKGNITDANGNGEAGTAKVSYAQPGNYKVTLTLQNSYGKAERTFSVIKVGNSTGIDGVENNDAQPKAYTVGEDIIVDCPQAGNYQFEVYAIDGTRLLAQAVKIAAGNNVRLHIANKGIFILKIRKDGKSLPSVKLLRQ